MIVGSYVLHLYCVAKPDCKNGRFGTHQATYEDGSMDSAREAHAQARARGWKLNVKRGWAMCPACVAAGAEITYKS